MIRVAVLCFAALATATAFGCTNAPQTVVGDDLRIPNACTESNPDTWTGLYACYFGPGQVGCSGQGDCHGGPGEYGAMNSGYICTSKDECWMSMTAGSNPNLFPPIVCLASLGCPGGVTDPTLTSLWHGVHQGPGLNADTFGNAQSNNMPCGNPTACSPSLSSYTFTPQDMQHIANWINQGAQDN